MIIIILAIVVIFAILDFGYRIIDDKKEAIKPMSKELNKTNDYEIDLWDVDSMTKGDVAWNNGKLDFTIEFDGVGKNQYISEYGYLIIPVSREANIDFIRITSYATFLGFQKVFPWEVDRIDFDNNHLDLEIDYLIYRIYNLGNEDIEVYIRLQPRTEPPYYDYGALEKTVIEIIGTDKPIVDVNAPIYKKIKFA